MLRKISKFEGSGLWSHASVYFSRFGPRRAPAKVSSTVVLRGHYIEVVACSSISRRRMHCTSTDLAAPSFPPDDVRKVPLHRPSLYATVGATSLSTTAEWGCDEKSWDSDFALGVGLPRADRQY